MAIELKQLKAAYEAYDNDEIYTDEIRLKTDTHSEIVYLMRQRCRVDKVRRVINGAEHDVVYLIDIDDACEHMQPEDLPLMVRATFIDEDNDCLSMFV